MLLLVFLFCFLLCFFCNANVTSSVTICASPPAVAMWITKMLFTPFKMCRTRSLGKKVNEVGRLVSV